MNKKNIAVLFLAGIFAASALSKEAKDNAVSLSLDYNGKAQCGYTVDYSSQGNFTQKGAVSTKSTTVHCKVRGVKDKPDMLTIKVDSIAITSDVYKDDAKKDIQEKLLKSQYSLSLASGFPSIDTTAEVPAAGYLQWDLYRQFAKLMPMLPAKPIKPGFTWERTFTLPLHTARGIVPCEMYRTYTFKKLNGDTALVSWDFRYTAGKKSVDSVSALDQIPVAGKGRGSAMLDVRNHCILKAEMDFATPIAVVGDISVTWQEKAVFSLVDCQ